MSVITDNTCFINVATGQYPVSFDEINAQSPNVSMHIDTVTIEDLRILGFELVTDSVIPKGDIVSEGVPVLTNGVYTRTWTVRAFVAEELSVQLTTSKQTLCTEVNTVRDNDISYGMRYTFPDGLVGGVQMRPEDRTNLVTMLIEAQSLAQAGDTTTTITFRSLENVTRELTALQTAALTSAAANFGKLIYASSWTLKDKIRAAATLAELPAVPTTLITLDS